MTETVTLAYVPPEIESVRLVLSVKSSRTLTIGFDAFRLGVALRNEANHVARRRLSTKVRNALSPGGTAGDPEDRPDEREKKIADRIAIVVAILLIEEHVENGQGQ